MQALICESLVFPLFDFVLLLDEAKHFFVYDICLKMFVTPIRHSAVCYFVLIFFILFQLC